MLVSGVQKSDLVIHTHTHTHTHMCVCTKRTFHARMNKIKDKNGMDLKEAEDIKKRWQEYTEELYKKDLQIITMV